MPQGKTYLNKILFLLLSKYERSKAFREGDAIIQRPQFVLKESGLAGDYFDELDYLKRETINEALVQLESAGVIETKWVRFQVRKEAERVYLNPEALEKAYSMAGISPKANKLEQLAVVFSPLSNHTWPWVRAYWTATVQQLKNRKSSGMDLEDLDGYADLVKVLQSLPSLTDVISKRVFSQRVFKDSKHFETKVERRLLSILKKHGPDEFEKDDEYLDAIGIVAHPKPVLVGGPLVFNISEQTVDISGLIGGTCLYLPTVKQMVVKHINTTRIITVENLTSYHQMIEVFPKDLVVFSGGFPHRTVQLLLKQISDYIKGLPAENCPSLFHWGDMDGGGFRIYQFIKANYFSQLEPLWMNEKTYMACLERGAPFDNKYASGLQAMRQDSRYEQFHRLIDLMLSKKIKIEQESIEPGNLT